MYEKTIVAKLQSDPALAALLSTFNSQPAVFTEYAPETAVKPFIVCRIDRGEPEGIVQTGSVFIDYFDFNKSREPSRQAAERIEFLLDEEILTGDARYAEVRLDLFAGSPIPETDPRDIHYNLQFSFRAVRSKWATETK